MTVTSGDGRRGITIPASADVWPAIGPYAALLLLVVISSVVSPAFLSQQNLTNILRQAAPLGIVALGQTIVILVKGLDVSVGALISLATVITASEMASSNARILPTMLIVCAVAVAVGTVNGVLVARLRADPFVSTLSTMLILIGATLIYTQGSPRSSLTPEFRWISEGSVLGRVPVSVLVFVALFLILLAMLRGTVWGRRVYVVGANDRVAALTGHPVVRTQLSAYILCSVLAALAGVFLVARLGSGDVTAGEGWELNSIAAVLIGGTKFGGGRGGVGGTVAGVFIVAILLNLVSLLALPAWVRLIVQGLAVIVGVALYSARRRATA
jgi:ribose transport system permease protein